MLWTMLIYLGKMEGAHTVLHLGCTIYPSYINVVWKMVLKYLKIAMCYNNNCDSDMKNSLEMVSLCKVWQWY